MMRRRERPVAPRAGSATGARVQQERPPASSGARLASEAAASRPADGDVGRQRPLDDEGPWSARPPACWPRAWRPGMPASRVSQRSVGCPGPPALSRERLAPDVASD